MDCGNKMIYSSSYYSDDSDISFEFLPLEIIVNIINYLPLKDIKSSTSTCKHWREAIKHPKIQQKFHLELSLSKIISYHNMITVFQKSTSKYTELHIDTCYRQLEQTDIYKLIRNSIPNALKTVKCLIFDRTKVTFDSLYLILSQMTQLKHLKIIACELYYTNTENLPNKCQNTIENLQIFEMEKSNITSYERLASILSMTSNLIEFNINCTSYGSCKQSQIQSKILSEIIQHNSLTLKKLYLKSFEFGESFLKICNSDRLKNMLKLEALSVLLDHRAGLYINEFEIFLSKQNQLKYLDICTFPTVQLTPENLLKLKHLKIFSCLDDLKNFDLHVISKFENLKTLELKGEINLQSYKQPKINTSLKEITLEMLSISDFYIESISKAFVNLTILELSSSKIYDTTMQAIIKNLKNLKKLKVDTFKGSDYGFTGIDPDTGKQDGVAIWQLQKLENLKLFYTRALDCQTVTTHFKFKNLKIFFFENTKIRWKYSLPIEYIMQIINNCPELETLRFSYNEEVSTQSIRKLKEIYDKQNRIISRDFKNCIKIKNLK